MKKFFSFLLALTAAVAVNAATLQATLDFSTTETYGIPTSGDANRGPATYNVGGYQITLTAGANYKKNSGYLLLGQQNSTLTLPAFTFPVSKIEVVGTSGASTAVKQNIFVGDEEISDETTGARNVTNAYLIPKAKRAAGTIFTLKVTSKANTQISKIKIYEAEESDPEPECARQDTISVHAAIERIKASKTNPCYVVGVVDSIELFYLIDGNINVWMTDTAVATDTIKGFKILNTDGAKFVAGENIPFAKGDTVRIHAKKLELYTDKAAGNKQVYEINEGEFAGKVGVSTAVTPTQPINPDTISVDSALVLLAKGDMDLHIVRGAVKSFDDVSTLSSEGLIKEMTIQDIDKPSKTIVGYLIYGGPDNARFAATRKCGLPFILGDTILVLSKSLKDYNGKKEINGGYYVSRDGKEDREDRCEICKEVPDTISVDSALIYIANEGYCHQIVKGVVASHSKSIKSTGAIEEVILQDCDDAAKTIKCYNMYAGYNGTDTAKYADIYELQFVKGDTIYVYGKSLEPYTKDGVTVNELTKFVYYHGREGVLKRTVLYFDQFVPTPDDIFQDNIQFDFTTQGLPLALSMTPSHDYQSLSDTYVIAPEANIKLTLGDGSQVALQDGEIVIDVDSMVGDQIYYSIDIDVIDAAKMHYMQSMNFVSNLFVNDNPNVTVARAFEIGMSIPTDNGATNKLYNVYGYRSAKTVSKWDSGYKNHSFYMSDNADAYNGFFEAYRVGPTSGKDADSAKVGDMIVVKNIQIKKFVKNGSITIENVTNASYAKVTTTPVIRDVEAPEKTVAQARTEAASLTTDYQTVSRFFTVVGKVAETVENGFNMVLGTDTVGAYKCVVEVENQVVEQGDNVKVRGVLQYYKGTIRVAYGAVVDIEKATALPEVLLERSYNKAQKLIENGNIIILKNGIRYNSMGARLDK